MFEKLRQFLDDGKSMLEDAFVVPDDENFIPVPPGVTEEELIEEAKQYVDAIIVPHHDGHHNNLVGVEMVPKPSAESEPVLDTCLEPEQNTDQQSKQDTDTESDGISE